MLYSASTEGLQQHVLIEDNVVSSCKSHELYVAYIYPLLNTWEQVLEPLEPLLLNTCSHVFSNG